MKIRRSVLQIFGLSILVMLVMFGIITPTLSPARAAEINLKFATLFPPQDPMCFGPQFMFKELEKRTNGKVKVTEYYSQSLGKAPEMLDMIETGIADFITFPIAVFPKVFQMSSVMSLPGLIKTCPVAGEVMFELGYRGLLDHDFARYKPLIWEGTDPMGFGFVKKKVTNLEELRKLKVRAPGGVQSEVLEALGPSVVTIPTADIYMALDRGVADGLTTMPGWFITMKMNEVVKYWLLKPMGIGANLTIMTKAKWNSLPDDVKAVIAELIPEAKYYFLQKVYQQIPSKAARLSELGVQVYKLDPAEEARWNAILDKYIEKWTAEMEAKGLPAKETVEATKQIVKRYEGS